MNTSSDVLHDTFCIYIGESSGVLLLLQPLVLVEVVLVLLRLVAQSIRKFQILVFEFSLFEVHGCALPRQLQLE